VDGQFFPKPQIEPFKILIKKFEISPEETVFIEDIAKNLSPGKELGLKTVWLINNEYWGKQDSDKNFIDLKIENLSSFLKQIRLLQAA
jgi:putative hydrolase of the HAD superfamily